jgi:uncharacterized protein
MIWLALCFGLTAALYASVGFGGGSTYTALLTLSGTDFTVLPAISLICNIIVVTGGSIRFARAGEVDWKRVIPLVAVSAPLAWMGGLTPIGEPAFKLVLAISLLAAGLLLVQKEPSGSSRPLRTRSTGFDIAAGAGTGYLAGLVGIGGGIFLAPILHLTHWGSARRIAATASIFILINSIAGLAGQMMKLAQTGNGIAAVWHYWPLMIAVLIGGQLGSFAALRLLSQSVVRRATAILILYVAGQLLWKLAAG